MSMKLFIFLYIAFALFLPTQGMLFDESWNNPHRVYFGAKQSFIQPVPTPRPDLETVKQTSYAPFSYSDDSGRYLGILKIVPFEKTLKVTGMFFKHSQAESLSLLEGKIAENKDSYSLTFDSHPANKFLGTSKAYNKKIEFPGKFLIRSHPSQGVYITPSADTKSSSSLYGVLPQIQKMFSGRWRSEDAEGNKWIFRLEPLDKNQLRGTIEVNGKNLQCQYSTLVVPAIDNGAWFFTGDWVSSKNSDCPARVWYSDANTITMYKNLYAADGLSEDLSIEP